MKYLQTLPYSSGKLGVIGYCSGGRQSYIVACNLPFDAAVDCYGGQRASRHRTSSPTVSRCRRST